MKGSVGRRKRLPHEVGQTLSSVNLGLMGILCH
jgi:hypothetical protein